MNVLGSAPSSAQTCVQRWKGASHLLPVFAAILALQCGAVLAFTLRWPMLGDATLMHYVVFLMQKGMAPYREILDMNMPGTYASEWLVMRVLGPGSLAWRLWDIVLLLATTIAMAGIAGRGRQYAALAAGSLFALLHLQDGIPYEGQRDLLMTVLSLSSIAALSQAMRSGLWWPWSLVAGLALGGAVTVKPTALVFGAVFLWAAVELRRRRFSFGKPLLAAVVGFLVCPLAVFVFLMKWHSLHAFSFVLTKLLPYDASIGRRAMSYFFNHGLSPVQPLGGIAVFLGIARIVHWFAAARSPAAANSSSCGLHKPVSDRWPEMVLFLGVICGAASYAVQGKGYPYHRYPLLACFLLEWALLSEHALKRFRPASASRAAAAVVAATGILYAGCAAAPTAGRKALRFQPEDVFAENLRDDLQRQGGYLSGKIQCIDMSAGCVKVLWRMRLVQSTGTMYEYTFLNPRDSQIQSTLRYRFLEEIEAKPPVAIVVTDQDYLFGEHGYAKLDRWPALQAFLKAHYSVYADRRLRATVRWEARSAPAPGYRIYILREPRE